MRRCAAPATAAGSQRDAPAAVSVRVRGGVVRWYTTAAPDRELLALLVLDERRFVAWTPALRPQIETINFTFSDLRIR